MLRRKGKDKAKEHFQKTGKYDAKATRRLIAFYEKVKPIATFPTSKN
jgi:hypothetical protein